MRQRDVAFSGRVLPPDNFNFIAASVRSATLR